MKLSASFLVGLTAFTLSSLSFASTQLDTVTVAGTRTELSLKNNPTSVSVLERKQIEKSGQENMEVVVKKGETLEHYKSNGEIGEGEGAKAGVAYRLKDGSMVYVPE